MSKTDTTANHEHASLVEQFIDELEVHGKHGRTQSGYHNALKRFESHLLSRSNSDEEADQPSIETANHYDCAKWVNTLRNEGLADSTIAIYARYVNGFYRYMVQIGKLDSNPMKIAIERMDETIDRDPERRDISIPEMQSFVSSITHPLDRSLVVTLLKTGMRVGELCNLDLRDLEMLEPQLSDVYPSLGDRPQLDGRGISVYIDDRISKGDKVNGEVRTASNKRKRGTVVPVDSELQSVLRTWLAVRPDTTSPAGPLFTNTSTKRYGERLHPERVRHRLQKYTRPRGWYQDGGGAETNVTPHYFRHFFTTHLRDRTGDRGIVKYIRGDVASDIIDTYTHDWGGRVREVYEENIYSLI